jgi:HK97 gp10 family phage protein
MADGVSVDVSGLDEVINKMRNLSYDVRYAGGRFALLKAAQVVRDAAIVGALRIDDPASRENISKNIVAKWNGRLFKRSGDLGFRVGVLGGAGGNLKREAFEGNPGGDTRHWRQIEFGVPSRGIPARPFMLPAIQQNIDKATNTFITQYGKALDRAIRKASKAKK